MGAADWCTHAVSGTVGRKHSGIGSADNRGKKSLSTQRRESTIGEILENPAAKELVNQFTNGMFTSLPKETLDFMVYRKLNDILSMGMIQVIPDTVKLHAILQGL